jgi:hypothetical protein
MRRPLAVLAIAFFASHAAVHLGRGEPYDLLWSCHIATLLVAAGLLWRVPMVNAVGVLWACFGLPIWLLYLRAGGEFIPTSTLTHLGGLAIGLYSVRLLGLPRGSAWYALGAYVVLWLVTRAVTPRSANVNVAFFVYPGWEDRFTTYPIYFATLLAIAALSFLIGEILCRQIPARGDRSQVRV